MSKTPKPLSAEEQLTLRNKAKAELDRLDCLTADEETQKKIDDFKDKFSICEIVYKVVLKVHQANKGKDPERYLKVTMSQAPHALAYAGYDFDYELLNKLFGAEERIGRRSVKKLRDSLTHSINAKAVEELRSREDELYGYMDRFLEKIRTFDEPS